MKKPLITVKIKKPYAGMAFVLFLAGSVWMFVNVTESHNGVIANVFHLAVALTGAGIAGFGLFALFTGRLAYNPKGADKGPFITVTDEGVTCDYSNGKTEKILWNSISRIRVWTTDEGPYVCDVFFVLIDADEKGVIIPQDKEESKLVLDKILKFPEFDHAAFIESMSSAQNKFFDVWEKK